MTEEAELKTKLASQCNKLGAYARRFEDRYGVGILDMLVAFHDLPVCFIEGKIIRASTFGPTERQYVEGTKLIKLRGGYTIPVLIGWDENKIMHVGEWTRKLPVKACYMQQNSENYATTLWSYLNAQQLSRKSAR